MSLSEPLKQPQTIVASKQENLLYVYQPTYRLVVADYRMTFSPPKEKAHPDLGKVIESDVAVGMDRITIMHVPKYEAVVLQARIPNNYVYIYSPVKGEELSDVAKMLGSIQSLSEVKKKKGEWIELFKGKGVNGFYYDNDKKALIAVGEESIYVYLIYPPGPRGVPVYRIKIYPNNGIPSNYIIPPPKGPTFKIILNKEILEFTWMGNKLEISHVFNSPMGKKELHTLFGPKLE